MTKDEEMRLRCWAAVEDLSKSFPAIKTFEIKSWHEEPMNVFGGVTTMIVFVGTDGRQINVPMWVPYDD